MSSVGLRSSTFYLTDNSVAKFVDDSGITLELNEAGITSKRDVEALGEWLIKIAQEL